MRMWEKQSLTRWSGRSLVASFTMPGKSREPYMISGARSSSEDTVT